MSLFDRFPSDVLAALRTELGARPRILTWGRTSDGYAVGLPDRLSISEAAGWRHVAWHQIDHGEWDEDTSTMRWSGPAGDGSVRLTDPGRLPDLLRDRVAASIAVERRVSIPGTRNGAIVMARRDLGDPSAVLEWRVVPGRGTRLSLPAVAAAADAALAETRAEYE